MELRNDSAGQRDDCADHNPVLQDGFLVVTVKGLNSYGLAIDSERGSCMRATKEYRLSCTEEAKKIVDRLTLEQKVWLMSGNIDITRMRQEDMAQMMEAMAG